MGVLTAGYLSGSVSLGGGFAQTAPMAPTPAQTQTAPAAKEQSEGNDAAESAALASQAKITAEQANAAALAQFAGGTGKKTELGSENGTVPYGIKLAKGAGKPQDLEV